MNKLLVVAKNPDTYFIKRLREEVGQENLHIYNPWVDEIPIGFDRGLFRSSSVYHSDWDLEYARKCQIPLMNPLKSLEIFRSKSSQYEFFFENHLPSLPWCWLAKWQEQFVSELYLVKPDRGQGGWGIEVLTFEELKEFKTKQISLEDLSWIIQPYVKATEYRVFFMGANRLTLKRAASLDHKAANFAQDGEASLVSLPDHLTHITEALIQKSGAHYGAIDLLDPSSGAVFLELNVVPGIEQLEKITGLNIIQMLLTANFFCHNP